MEALHEDYDIVPVPVPHDLGPTTPEAVALQALIDQLGEKRSETAPDDA